MNAGELEKVGFGIRWLAWLIDMALLWAASAALLFIFAGTTAIMDATSSGLVNFMTSAFALLLVAVNFLLQFLYFGFFWSRSGQSLGMKMMNARVIRQNQEGLSFVRGGLRGTVGYYISSLVFWLGYLWALFDKDGETWHDKIFDTWVVRNKWVG